MRVCPNPRGPLNRRNAAIWVDSEALSAIAIRSVERPAGLGGIRSVPRYGSRDPAVDRINLVTTVQLLGRLGERGIRAAPHNDALLFSGHRLDHRTSFL